MMKLTSNAALRRQARTLHRKEDAEDFIQDTHLRRLEGKGLKQNASRALLDYIRRTVHNTRSASRRPRFVPIEEYEGMGSMCQERIARDELLAFEQSVGCMPREARAIYYLHAVFGFTQADLGRVFGVASQTIAQIMERHAHYVGILDKEENAK